MGGAEEMATDLQPCVSSPRLPSPPGEGLFLAVASEVPALPLTAASAQLCPERWSLTTAPPPRLCVRCRRLYQKWKVQEHSLLTVRAGGI